MSGQRRRYNPVQVIANGKVMKTMRGDIERARNWPHEHSGARAAMDDSSHVPKVRSLRLLRRGMPLGDRIPVDHVEECGNVVRSAILIVEVVGVFPDVESENRRTWAFSDTGH